MPQLQSYALIKRFQLCMLQDDTDGAKTAMLSAIEAEQKQLKFPPSLTLILCRLLSAHLNLRQETPLERLRGVWGALQICKVRICRNAF